jgi:hypothetical protein
MSCPSSGRWATKDATTTLNTYSHLWPRADDRTHKASEEMFLESPSDALQTDNVETGC